MYGAVSIRHEISKIIKTWIACMHASVTQSLSVRESVRWQFSDRLVRYGHYVLDKQLFL